MLSFTLFPGKPGRSRISYSHNNAVTANIPFPDDAADIVYDERRPYLSCTTAVGVEPALEFFTKGLVAEGWSVLTPDAIATRWPNAKIGDAIEGGARAYFNREGRENQYPVMLTLRRTADGKTAVDIRSAPFALPQDIPFREEIAGIPTLQHTTTVSVEGSRDSVRRLSRALVIAEIPAVLAFYRRELTSRGWTENASATTVSETAAKLAFSSAGDQRHAGAWPAI